MPERRKRTRDREESKEEKIAALKKLRASYEVRVANGRKQVEDLTLKMNVAKRLRIKNRVTGYFEWIVIDSDIKGVQGELNFNEEAVAHYSTKLAELGVFDAPPEPASEPEAEPESEPEEEINTEEQSSEPEQSVESEADEIVVDEQESEDVQIIKPPPVSLFRKKIKEHGAKTAWDIAEVKTWEEIAKEGKLYVECGKCDGTGTVMMKARNVRDGDSVPSKKHPECKMCMYTRKAMEANHREEIFRNAVWCKCKERSYTLRAHDGVRIFGHETNVCNDCELIVDLQ